MEHFDALVDWSVPEAFYLSLLFPDAVHQQKPLAEVRERRADGVRRAVLTRRMLGGHDRRAGARSVIMAQRGSPPLCPHHEGEVTRRWEFGVRLLF